MNETNTCAEKAFVTSRSLRGRYILNLWVPVVVEEIKKLIAVIYHMGLVSMPSCKHYWWKFCTNDSKDRFLAILRFLHFGDSNET